MKFRSFLIVFKIKIFLSKQIFFWVEFFFLNEYGFYDENAFRMTHYCNDDNLLLAYGELGGDFYSMISHCQ